MIVEVAGILIQNIDGDFLMCHPTNHPDIWSLPKGHIEEGENPKDTAIRETIEETNLDVTKLDGILTFLTTHPYKIEGGRKTKNLHVFLFKSNVDMKKMELDIKCVSSFTTQNGDILEMDKHEWFDYDKVMEKGMRFMKNILTDHKKDLFINLN